MAHINPPLPTSGDVNWATPLNNAIATIVSQVNSHDDQIGSNVSIVSLTQAQFNALSSPNPTTLYLITG